MNKKIIDIFIVFFCSLVYNLIVTTSVYLPNPGSDSTIYQTLGLAILQGKTPYVDLFEQKGIVLFWLNAIGIWLSPKVGLLALCIISTSISFYIWLKMASLFFKTWLRWIPMIFGVMLCVINYGDANFTEMWALPGISYMTYLVVIFLKERIDIDYKECFIIGLILAINFFIRVNNTIPVIASCLFVGYFLIKNEQIKRLWKSIGFVLMGFCLAFLFVIVLFIIQYGINTLPDMYFGMVGYNLNYFKNFGGGNLWANALFIISSFLFLILLLFKNLDKRIIVYIFLIYVTTYMTMGKAYFHHYYLILIPAIVYSVIVILERIPIKMVKVACYSFVIAAIFGVFGISFTDNPVKGLVQRKISYSEVFPPLLTTIEKTIPEEERMSIWNYTGRNLGSNLLRLNQICQCNRVILSNPGNNFLEPVSIKEYMPLWVIVNPQRGYLADGDSLFIWNNYHPMIKTEAFAEDDIIFLKLNDINAIH